MNEQPNQAKVLKALAHQGEPSGGVHHHGSAAWVTQRDFDRAVELTEILAAQVRWLESRIQSLYKAIDASGQDILPCHECGEPLVTLPCPPVMCDTCAEQMAEQETP